MPKVEIKRLNSDFLNEDSVRGINRLFLALTSRPNEFLIKNRKEISKILNGNCCYVVACVENKVVGISGIHFLKTGIRSKGFIEDVVVDRNYRGRGIGILLSKKLIEIAKDKNLDCIDLTSSPNRKEANMLYKKLGFKTKETNYYRLKI
jgi:ribosomal protein S18 acetylase RimI-like enzyme